MKIYISCGTHFSHPSEIRRYGATRAHADSFAADLVNLLRADIDNAALPPVSVAQWQDGLTHAQRHRLEAFGSSATEIPPSELADEAGFDVWIEEADIEGMSTMAVNDRELATLLAALRLYQQADCPTDLLDIATNGGAHNPMTPDEIDGLCEKINAGGQHEDIPDVVVAIEGGLVSGVVADRPVRLLTVDYDTEGAQAHDLTLVPQDNHDPVEAIVGEWSGNALAIDPGWIAGLDAAIAQHAEN